MRIRLASYPFALIAISLLAACGEETATVAADPTGRPVKLIEIQGSSDQRSTRYPAVIGAGTTADLSFQVGGVILELAVTDAQQVDEGQLIARLDARDFESSVSSAQASFANAEDEYQRAVRLAAQDAIATNVLEQRKTQRDVAKAQLDSAEKALTDSVLRAPFAGVIANVPVRAQQAITPGSSVATLINISQLKATVNLPASVVALVPTQEDRKAVVMLEAAPGVEIEATFREANLVADATSQTYAVTFSFTAPGDMLVLPGMNATVLLTSSGNGNIDETVSVPLAAVQSDGEGQYVWLVDGETMTVSRRNIVVAPGIGETVVVTDGLSAGDQIVGAGGAYLSSGVLVTPWTE